MLTANIAAIIYGLAANNLKTLWKLIGQKFANSFFPSAAFKARVRINVASSNALFSAPCWDAISFFRTSAAGPLVRLGVMLHLAQGRYPLFQVIYSSRIDGRAHGSGLLGC